MQEEVENRTVNLAISTTKLTACSIVRLGLKGIAYIKRKSQEAALKNEKPTGKQTIQELIGQNQGVTNIDISKTDPKGFEGMPGNTVSIMQSPRINLYFHRSTWCSLRPEMRML